jgi:hypothetical protein
MRGSKTRYERRSANEFPVNKGGGAKRLGVVCAGFLNPPGQPPEAFAFFSPLLRGNVETVPKSETLVKRTAIVFPRQ